MRRLLLLSLRLLLLAAFLLAPLPGCWDTDRLVDKKIINGIALDEVEDGKILGSASTIRLINKGGGEFEERDEVTQATGDSIAKIGLLINNMMPGKLEASKTHVIIIGEELARKGLLENLEIFYRHPKGNLSASLLIARGTASDILTSGKTPSGSPLAFDIMQMIRGAQFATIAPEQTLFTLWTDLLDLDADIVIPIIAKRTGGRVTIDSVALMDGDRFTGGILPQNDSKLLMLMKGWTNKSTLLELSLSDHRDRLVFEVTKARSRIEAHIDEATGQIDCNIRVFLRGDVSSFPIEGDFKHNSDKLSAIMASALQKQAGEIVGKLQAANCDALGVGRRIKRFYPDEWKELDWKKAYPDIRFTTEFKIDFVGSGILN